VSGDSDQALMVWRLLDGKPGHENQSLGLVQGLKRLLPGASYVDIDISARRPALLSWLRGRFPPGAGLPAPDLILGAGHRTHWPLLAARRAFGGRAVVMMKPSLPLSLFDLCVIPEHDGVAAGPKVFVTRGVLNPLTAGGSHHADQTLILIGGPSRHHGWDDQALLAQIRKIAAAEPQKRLVLTTSRRTPTDFRMQIEGAAIPNLQLVPYEQTPPGWVASTLSASATAWVTADSVSMVYEALTAGVRVGILDAPLKQPSRVVEGLNRLLAERRVVGFSQWARGEALPSPSPAFAEADRCAAWIIEQWQSGV